MRPVVEHKAFYRDAPDWVVRRLAVQQPLLKNGLFVVIEEGHARSMSLLMDSYCAYSTCEQPSRIAGAASFGHSRFFGIIESCNQ
jgi:hypothetical protein